MNFTSKKPNPLPTVRGRKACIQKGRPVWTGRLFLPHWSPITSVPVHADPAPISVPDPEGRKFPVHAERRSPGPGECKFPDHPANRHRESVNQAMDGPLSFSPYYARPDSAHEWDSPLNQGTSGERGDSHSLFHFFRIPLTGRRPPPIQGGTACIDAGQTGIMGHP